MPVRPSGSDLIDLIQVRLEDLGREKADELAAGNAPDYGAYRLQAGIIVGLREAGELVAKAYRDWGRDEEDED